MSGLLGPGQLSATAWLAPGIKVSIPIEGYRLVARRLSAVHKNHPAKTVFFCRGRDKMKRVHIKLLIYVQYEINFAFDERKTSRNLWARFH